MDSKKPTWWLTKDGDKACLDLYSRHYSAYDYKDGRERKLFVGPGEKLVLRTWEGNAMLVWRRFIDDSGQCGVNCAVFRNESGIRSSDLIREADAIAFKLWPNCRHYTFVNAERIKSNNPGACFLAAGWQRLKEKTGSGLRILEKLPN
jgi:hypothetical protein